MTMSHCLGCGTYGTTVPYCDHCRDALRPVPVGALTGRPARLGDATVPTSSIGLVIDQWDLADLPSADLLLDSALNVRDAEDAECVIDHWTSTAAARN